MDARPQKKISYSRQLISHHLGNWISRCETVYRDNLIVQGMAQATALLIGVLALDSLCGFSVSTRALYILPIWVATRKAGPAWALLVILAITSLQTAIDHHSGLITHDNIAIQGFMRLGSYLVIMGFIWGIERRLEKVLVQAMHDPLTGVLNRAALHQYANYQIDRAKENNQPLILAIVDCDKFKAINDEFGHAVGDFILRLLSRHLETAMRGGGLVARTGGDEFVVIVQNTGMESAKALFRRLNDSFVRTSEDRGCKASISFGLASLGIDGQNLEDLMQAADHRMYLSKAVIEAKIPAPDENDLHVYTR